jgi:hypothetical protein
MSAPIRIELDEHERTAPYESDRWASSDRGWVFAYKGEEEKAYPSYGRDYVTVGHYLDYGPEKGPANVHAVCCVTRESCHVATPKEAIAWIMAQASGKVAGYFANEALARGAWTHDADAIRKLTVDESIQLSLVVAS